MPVFNLELRFNDRGALEAVNQINNIADAADNATDAIDNLGDSGSSSGRELARMGNTGSKAADAIADKMKKVAGQVLGLVAAFTAVDKAMGFMNRGLEFNASLEQSQIGIASLITSMVKLQDAQGKLLDGQEKYNAAQEISRGLMEQIQTLGLQTTADSQSIIEGFQSILAPALEAGIALENIPKFAVQGAQALQTLGVPLNQMRTELDALLTGSVNLSQDILAPKLFADVKGNLKEYIQGLKQAGKLEDEIFKRLEPYNLALKDTENTWAAISSNLGEALDKLAGDTSLNYTRAMKQSLSEINNLIIDTNTGKISKDFENIAKQLTVIQDWIGNKIVGSVETLIEYAKEFNSFLGTDIGQGALTSFTSALKLAAGALAGFTAARALAFGNNKFVNIINSSTAATEKYKNATIALRTEQRNAAYAELSRYQTWMQSAQAQRQMMSSSQQRQAILAREIQLVNQAAAAEQRLVAAQTMSSNRAALGGAWKGLVNFLGGPFNAAFMTAGLAVAALSLKQSDAEKAAELHAKAEEEYANSVGKATDATGKLTRALTEGEKARAAATLRTIQADWDSQIALLENNLQRIRDALQEFDLESHEWVIASPIEQQAVEDTKALLDQFNKGQVDAENFNASLGKIYATLKQGGLQDTQIAEFIDSLLKNTKLEEVQKRLQSIKEALGLVKSEAKGGVSVVQEAANGFAALEEALNKTDDALQANVNSLDGALAYIKKMYSATDEGKTKQKEMAKAVLENAIATLKLEAAQRGAEISTILFNATTGKATEEQLAQVDAKLEALNKLNEAISQGEHALSEYGKEKPAKTGRGGGGRKSSGGGSSIDPVEAAKKWEELTDQLAQLQGKSTGAEASLKKTLDEIAKTGKEAKKSARDIEKLQKAFREATDTKTIKELNKELLQLEGNTRAVEEIEKKEKTDQFKARLSEIKSLSKDEKNILLGRFEKAAQREIKVNDLQVAVDFMKDLESLGGEYGLTIQKQNELIEYQASLYRDKLPSDMQPYINQWEKLKKQSNDTSFMAGLQRGLNKFGDDYGNLANQVESFTIQMGSTISSTLTDVFMTGKFSAQDFFQSLVSMAAQAANNYFIGMIFKGIGGMFSSGGIPTSGYSGTSSNTSAFGPVIPNGVYHSGGIVGPNHPTDRALPYYLFSDAPRLHSGGGFFRRDEYPAILQSGERVLNRDETRAYQAGISAGGNSDVINFGRIIAELQSQMREDRQYMGGNMPVINLNIENNSNADVQAGQMKQDGNGGFTMDIIISQVEQGIVGRMKQGKSQIAHYQEQAYGMNRAAVLSRGRGRS